MTNLPKAPPDTTPPPDEPSSSTTAHHGGVAARSPSTSTNTEATTELNHRPDGPGTAMFLFGGQYFPPPNLIHQTMGGFSRWGFITADQPPTEYINAMRWQRSFHFQTNEDAEPASTEPQTPEPSSPPDLVVSVRDGAGVGLFSAEYPYFLRFLAQRDPTIANILLGQDLFPRPVDAGNLFRQAPTRPDMTFRHLRPSGNVRTIGTDRISTGSNIPRMIVELFSRGTGEVVRVDPRVVVAEGATFLTPRQLLTDMNLMQERVSLDLDSLQREGAGSNKIGRTRQRLGAVNSARNYLGVYGEGQAVDRVPSLAMGEVTSLGRESATYRALQGVRITGGVLIVWGAYESLDRIARAQEQRARVVTQEVGGWTGAITGAYAVGQLFRTRPALVRFRPGGRILMIGLVGTLLGGIFGDMAGRLGADAVYARAREDHLSERATGPTFEDITDDPSSSGDLDGTSDAPSSERENRE